MIGALSFLSIKEYSKPKNWQNSVGLGDLERNIKGVSYKKT